MKVLHKPDVSKWSYKHKCTNCDCELEIEASDLKHYHYDGDSREPGYDSYSIVCAVCTQSFTIPSDKIPRLIQISAKKNLSASDYYNK